MGEFDAIIIGARRNALHAPPISLRKTGKQTDLSGKACPATQ